jgi:two-component system, LytTR family, response regulator
MRLDLPVPSTLSDWSLFHPAGIANRGSTATAFPGPKFRRPALLSQSTRSKALNLLLAADGLSRGHLAALCAQSARSAHIVAEVSSAAEAAKAAGALRPDAILVASFLSDMSGLAAVQALRDRDRRRVILVTTTPREREDALAAGVLDFLMVPVQGAAFELSLLRAYGRFGTRRSATCPSSRPVSAQSARLLDHERPFVLIAERERRLYPVRPHQIDYVESAGNYVKFHVQKCEYIARESMKRLESLLNGKGFVRIERTVLLNVLAISFVETVGHGAFAFTLNTGACLHSGPAYRETILRALPLRRRARRDSPNRNSQAFAD